VELDVQPVAGGTELREGGEAAIRFRVADAATGTPWSGASPAAWLDLVGSGRRDATPCAEAVEQLLSGSFFRQPAVDLNAYYLLALNEDPSISVLDPLSGFGGSRLLAQVGLSSPGADWVLSPDRSRLYVSQPAAGKVAAVDTASWQMIAQIDAGARPGRLALEPDGRRLWVANADGVAAIDTARLAVAARLGVGDAAGTERDLVLTDDGRRLFVTDRAAHTLAAIDTARLVKLRDVILPAGPSSIAWSQLAHAVYAVAGGEGKVFAVDAERLEVTATLAAEPGLGALRFAPGGRLGLVPNAQAGRVRVLDVAVTSRRSASTAKTFPSPPATA
jgi:DNA-binding beta-propeller fold protein YncE